MLFSLILIGVGLALLVVGGDVLLRGAVGLATLFRLTPAVIGLTVVAAGTSVPELAVTGIAAWQGKPDIAVANVVGSNIFNIAVIIGICALIRPIAIAGNMIRLEYPVLVLTTFLCLVLVQDGEINRLEALLFLAAYVGFTVYLVGLVRQQVTKIEIADLTDEVKQLSVESETLRPWLCYTLVTAGIVLLAGGAHVTVLGAVEVARMLGWSERVIGLTIVAAGTSLPEVFASIVSLARGRDDVAIGNVIGSNIFNILFILGLSAVIFPLPVSAALISCDLWWMLGVTLLLYPIMFTRLLVSRWEGALLLSVYGVYIALLLSDTQ